MNAKQAIAKIPSDNSELNKFVEQLTNRMLGQIRQNFSKLNSISKTEIEKLFTLSNLSQDDLKDILAEYPGGGYVMADPLYTLVTLIAIKHSIELDDRESQTASLLLSLIMLARLKYKYIRICDPEIITLAFNLMSKKTYIGTNGLVWGIYKISTDTFNKYKEKLVKNPNEMYYRYRYIIDIRNKFNQLMKHIAQMYYWVILNKDSIYTTDKIHLIADDITNYVATKNLNEDILNLIASMADSDISVIYEFQHQIQINDSFQNAINQIFFKMEEKLIAIKKYAASQKIEIDYTSLEFLREYYINSKRSSTLTALAKAPVFVENNFDSKLVLSFCSTIIVMWESVGKNTTKQSSEDSGSYESDNNDTNIYESLGFNPDEFDASLLEENFSELVMPIESYA